MIDYLVHIQLANTSSNPNLPPPRSPTPKLYYYLIIQATIIVNYTSYCYFIILATIILADPEATILSYYTSYYCSIVLTNSPECDRAAAEGEQLEGGSAKHTKHLLEFFSIAAVVAFTVRVCSMRPFTY